MIFSKKLFFFTCLVFLVFALPPAIIVPILLIQNKTQTFQLSPYYKHYSWDTEVLKKEIKETKTFVMYFGTPQCPYCKSLWKALEKDKAFQTKMKNLSKKTEQKLMLFSEDKSPSHKDRSSFETFLNQLLTENKMKKTPGVPFFVFFRDGKPVDEISPDPKKIPELLEKIKNIFPD